MGGGVRKEMKSRKEEREAGKTGERSCLQRDKVGGRGGKEMDWVKKGGRGEKERAGRRRSKKKKNQAGAQESERGEKESGGELGQIPKSREEAGGGGGGGEYWRRRRKRSK